MLCVFRIPSSSLSLSLSISRFQLDLVVVVKADSLVTTLIVTNKNREKKNSCRCIVGNEEWTHQIVYTSKRIFGAHSISCKYTKNVPIAWLGGFAPVRRIIRELVYYVHSLLHQHNLNQRTNCEYLCRLTCQFWVWHKTGVVQCRGNIKYMYVGLPH